MPMYLVNENIDTKPTYFGKKSNGVVLSGYYLFADKKIAERYKGNLNIIFANITKSLNKDVKITLEDFNSIMKKASNTIKTLTDDVANMYRKEISFRKKIPSFSSIMDLVSFNFTKFEDLYNFKKAIYEVTGYDGFVEYDENNNVKSAVAWFDEQINSFNNLMLDKLEKDTVLFSKYYDESEEDYFEDEEDEYVSEIDKRFNLLVKLNFLFIKSNGYRFA